MQLNILISEFFEYVSNKCKMCKVYKKRYLDRFKIDCAAEIFFRNRMIEGCRRYYVCMYVLGFYGPVNNEIISSRSVNSRTVPGHA